MAAPLTLPPPFRPTRPSRSANLCYVKLNRLQEGTFGVVFRAREKPNLVDLHQGSGLPQRSHAVNAVQSGLAGAGKIVAMKRVKLSGDSSDGFPMTEMREVKVLQSLRHENIVRLIEVVVGRSLNSVYIVMEYIEHDLHSVLYRMARGKTQRFSIAQVKCLVTHLMRGLRHLHANWVMHRDVKPANLLYGNDGVLRLCDFGLARDFGDPAPPAHIEFDVSGSVDPIERGPYTAGVVTLWYRAPEILLGSESYNGAAVDAWAAGAVMAEILTCEPLLPGSGELNQMSKMFQLLGTPDESVWRGFDQLPHVRRASFPSYSITAERLRARVSPDMLSSSGFDLLRSLLEYDPAQRMTAAEALEHDWLVAERPSRSHPSMMPSWPEVHET